MRARHSLKEQILQDIESGAVGVASHAEASPALESQTADKSASPDIPSLQHLVNSVRNIRSQTPQVTDARTRIDQMQDS
ncbi:hypothetical protein LPJ53_001610 [Coemansia erecta]|uniref:Uncharacterized protein n=1 Tax=Coemansia erecta TaxID=147472 RepID=A0A9W8CSN1_9FUNG|nr:hypothetical protein LPJ53_001610 [Coemansia erecta]